MAADELKVPFGKREDGSIVHISELTLRDNGLRCGCVCPKCDDPLQARNAGKVRQPYFAHDTQRSCEGAVESALHLFAKEVFLRHKSFFVPEHEEHVGWQSARVSAAVDMPYAGVAIEQRMGEVKPDVVLQRVQRLPMLVEIAVTHFVDEDKHEKLRKMGYPCIEVDLSDLISPDEFDRVAIEKALISDGDRKEWIFHPSAEAVRAALMEEARKKAEEYEQKKREEEERERRFKERRSRERQRVMSAKYQQMMIERTEQELATHPIWVANRRAFSLSENDAIPWYLNFEINGEYLWTVHRTVWQSALFRVWVFNKRDSNRSRYISVKFAIEQLHDTYPDIWEKCLYWAWKDDNRVVAPSLVIGEYLRLLERCGFLRGEGNWGQPYSWSFDCVLPRFLPMPPQYNNPRYLPRVDGVFDTEAKQDIKF